MNSDMSRNNGISSGNLSRALNLADFFFCLPTALRPSQVYHIQRPRLFTTHSLWHRAWRCLFATAETWRNSINCRLGSSSVADD